MVRTLPRSRICEGLDRYRPSREAEIAPQPILRAVTRNFRLSIAALAATAGLALAAAPDPPAPAQTADTAAARAIFEKNLAAIRDRDRAAYLSCYLEAPSLARTGIEGPVLGFKDLERSAGEGWPDTFEASDLRLMPLRSGVVYGTYRYRVRYGAQEQSGLSERLFLRIGNEWKIAMTSAFPAFPGTPPPPRALKGGTLIDGTGAPPVADAVVLMRDGKIACAGTGCEIPGGVAVTDVTGMWITPGLVDAHVHFSQTGWADGRPDSIDVRNRYPYDKVEADLEANPERFFRSQLCSGITSVFDVGGYPWTVAMSKGEHNDSRAPRVAAAGPLLSTSDHWLNLPAERQFIHLKDPEAARAGVRYLAAEGADAVKIWYIVSPERPVEDSAPSVLAAGEEAGKAGLPLIVHATGLAEAKVALRAGAKLLVHGVSDQPVDEEFLALAKKNGTVYCPTLTVVGGYLRMSRAAAAKTAPPVDDPNGCVDPATLGKVAGSADLAPVSADRLAGLEKRVADCGPFRVGQPQARRRGGNPDRDGHRRGKSVDPARPFRVRRDGGDAGGGPRADAGARRLDARRRARHGRRERDGHHREGKAADLLVVGGGPRGRHREPPQGEVRRARGRPALDRGAARRCHVASPRAPVRTFDGREAPATVETRIPSVATETSPVAIVGAGPTGIACAVELARREVPAVCYDRGSLLDAVYHFPEEMRWFSTRDLLDIAGVPFTTPDPHPTRLETLAYYRGVAERFGVRVEPETEILSIAERRRRTRPGGRRPADGARPCRPPPRSSRRASSTTRAGSACPARTCRTSTRATCRATRSTAATSSWSAGRTPRARRRSTSTGTARG